MRARVCGCVYCARTGVRLGRSSSSHYAAGVRSTTPVLPGRLCFFFNENTLTLSHNVKLQSPRFQIKSEGHCTHNASCDSQVAL
jgi:hypothetical protein